jgi:uncharacterized membrane protein
MVRMLSNSKILCTICNKEFLHRDLTPFALIPSTISELIKHKYENWDEGQYICYKDLNFFRSEYVKDSILKDQSEISDIEQSVISSLQEHESVTKNINNLFTKDSSFGDKLSDKIAEFGGSWKFIIIFFSVLAIWIALNSISLFKAHYDPYPFILLNLILSCLAAIQAPIIMMSQNRQADKDRLQAEMDYKINLKAELEIRHLKAKLDQLSSHQWQRLLEIQKLQTDLIQEMSQHKK